MKKVKGKRDLFRFLTALLWVALGAALVIASQISTLQSPPSISSLHQSASGPAEDVRAFHTQPPSGELPPTMAPSLFPDKIVSNTYFLAARVKKVLYQQPCYCHCDRSHGHGSLLDCFVGRHGAGCGTCIKEALYSYEQTRKGQTPAQIREAIIRGDWQSVDVTKYQKDLPTLPGTSAK